MQNRSTWILTINSTNSKTFQKLKVMKKVRKKNRRHNLSTLANYSKSSSKSKSLTRNELKLEDKMLRLRKTQPTGLAKVLVASPKVKRKKNMMKSTMKRKKRKSNQLAILVKPEPSEDD